MEFEIDNLKFVDSGSHVAVYRNGESWGVPQGDRFLRVLIKHIKALETANDLLHMENKEYEEALKFYANKDHYEEWNEKLDLTEYIHDVDFDGGDKARNVLGIEE